MYGPNGATINSRIRRAKRNPRGPYPALVANFFEPAPAHYLTLGTYSSLSLPHLWTLLS